MRLEVSNGIVKEQLDHAIKKSGGYIYKLTSRADGVHLEELKIVYANDYYIYLKIPGSKELCNIYWDFIKPELNESSLLKFIDSLPGSIGDRLRVGRGTYYFTCADISKMKKMLSEFNGRVDLVMLETAIRQEEAFIERQQKKHEKVMNDAQRTIQDLKTKKEKLLKKQKGEDVI